MIFAKLDVCFWRHKKFKRAGAAACGYYAAALAYLREDETRDGLLEDDVVGQLLDVGEREASKLIQRLVDVGLFQRKEGGYLLLGYAEKNETREQIEARRADTRRRVASMRARRGQVHGTSSGNAGSNAVQAGSVQHVGNDTHVTRYTSPLHGSVTGGAVPGSDSDSLSDSEISEGERERESGTRPAAPEDSGLGSLAPDDIPVTDRVKLHCAQAGAREPTSEDVAACLANARKKGYWRADWEFELVSWMIRGKRFDAGRQTETQTPTDSPSRKRISPLPPKGAARG